MKRNGFTLIELLATIVILSIISGIVVINYADASRKENEKQYDKIVEVIEENAKIVVNDNVDLYKSINDKAVNVTEGAICKFSYIELVNMKLMDEDTINPKTNKTINGDSYIVVNKKNNKLSYEFYYENIPEIEDCE